MAILASGLETISYGSQGWNAILTDDLELLDAKLVNVMTANKIPGVGTIAASSVVVVNPAAQTSEILTDSTTGTVSNTVGDVGTTFDQAGLNNIHASMVDEINKLRADVLELRTREVEYKIAISSLEAKINDILTKLRKSTGNGILGG